MVGDNSRVRPIGIPVAIRKLVARSLQSRFAKDLAAELVTCAQLAVGVQGGIEVAVHTMRAVGKVKENEWVRMSLDKSNAFNTVDKLAISEAFTAFPKCRVLAGYFDAVYAGSIDVLYNGRDAAGSGAPVSVKLEQESSLSQGDPLAPALFALAEALAMRRVRERLSAGVIDGIAMVPGQHYLLCDYSDDTNILAPPAVVGRIRALIAEEMAKVGVKENPEKTVVYGSPEMIAIFDEHNVDDALTQRTSEGSNLLKEGFREGSHVLGVPLGSDDYVRGELDAMLAKFDVVVGKVRDFAIHYPQEAYHMLRMSLTAKFVHLARQIEPRLMRDFAKAVDKRVVGLFETISSQSGLEGKTKERVHLPLRCGGMGIQSLLDTLETAWTASALAYITRDVGTLFGQGNVETAVIPAMNDVDALTPFFPTLRDSMQIVSDRGGFSHIVRGQDEDVVDRLMTSPRAVILTGRADGVDGADGAGDDDATEVRDDGPFSALKTQQTLSKNINEARSATLSEELVDESKVPRAAPGAAPGPQMSRMTPESWDKRGAAVSFAAAKTFGASINFSALPSVSNRNVFSRSEFKFLCALRLGLAPVFVAGLPRQITHGAFVRRRGAVTGGLISTGSKALSARHNSVQATLLEAAQSARLACKKECMYYPVGTAGVAGLDKARENRSDISVFQGVKKTGQTMMLDVTVMDPFANSRMMAPSSMLKGGVAGDGEKGKRAKLDKLIAAVGRRPEGNPVCLPFGVDIGGGWGEDAQTVWRLLCSHVDSEYVAAWKRKWMIRINAGLAKTVHRGMRDAADIFAGIRCGTAAYDAFQRDVLADIA